MDPRRERSLAAALEGRYRLRQEIGSGGMATVHLADDLRHDRPVAVKVLRPELTKALGAERFLGEIRTTAKLQHPNILPLFDSGEAGGSLYYVMPYVAGESLRERLERTGPLPVEDALRIAEQLADALDYAHRQGVVHRDVKPANVLLHDGRVLLTDFGIALALEEAGGERLTGTGLTLGTPQYMSPEQAMGDRHVGLATDVWALGCILHEMLVGEAPYDGGNAQAVVARILTGETEAPSHQRPSVPPNVDAAVRKALERLPADRFRSAGAFGSALSDPSFRHGPGDAVREVIWRRPAVAATGWALAAVLAAGLAWSAARPGPALERPVRRTSIPLPGPVANDRTDPVAISADGSRVAYVVGWDVHTRDLSEAAGTPVPGIEVASSVALSPDGEWIAAFDPVSLEILKAPVGGGPEERVAPLGGVGIGGLDWGPDGSIVFSSDGSLLRVPPAGGAPQRLTDAGEDDAVEHIDPDVLPDGSGVVFTVRKTEYPYHQRVALLTFGDTAVALTDGHSPRVAPDGILVFAGNTLEGGRGGLWAARLADGGRSLAGEPILVMDDFLTSPGANGRALYDVAEDGTLIHLPPLSTRTVDALLRVDRSGAEEVLLELDSPQLPPDVLGFSSPRVSPDGERIAFRGHGGTPAWRLFVLDLGREVLSAVPVDANADWPVWTPDGRELVFNRFTAEGQDLYRAPVDAAGEPRPFHPPNEHQQHPLDFTPDGEHLVIQHREGVGDADSDILLLDAGGDEDPRPLVASAAFEQHASLSSDGRWMAFVSDASGQREVYVTDFPGARSRTKVSAAPATSPVWNPAGGELFYRRAEDGAVMAVAVSGDGALEAGAPSRLFTGRYRTCCVWGRSFDAFPDGRSFLMTRERAGDMVDAPRIEITQNWLAEVAERLDPR